MNYALLLLLMGFQNPTPPATVEPSPIWEELSKLEVQAKNIVKENRSGFYVPNGDSVYAYYIERVGVVLLVPVRYRSPKHPMGRPNAAMPKSTSTMSSQEITSAVKEWEDKLAKDREAKDTNFETVVKNMRDHIPQMIAVLNHLPSNESLVVVVEERVPAWFRAGFNLNKDPRRKVATLTVDKDLISMIHSKETVMPPEWFRRIKLTTTNRKLDNPFSATVD